MDCISETTSGHEIWCLTIDPVPFELTPKMWSTSEKNDMKLKVLTNESLG